MKIKSKFKNLLKNKKTRNIECIKEISYEELKEALKCDENIEVVDIRSPQEFMERRIEYAINIPLYDLNKKASALLPDKDKLIVLYCGCGVRSKKAYKILEEKGYTNLYSLKGGLDNV